ncbi:hypothetical protein MMC21_007151 [Puttea exsequens]|nr:hypothetical protein [Puttea exsequens]
MPVKPIVGVNHSEARGARSERGVRYAMKPPETTSVASPLLRDCSARRARVSELIFVPTGLGTTMGYFYWYGYHVPAVRRRDLFYAKLEQEREDGTV